LGGNGRANPAIGYRVALPTVNRKTECKEAKKLHLTRSGSARRRANVPIQRCPLKITGRKTEAIFERYNIQTTDDVREALIKVGQ
jgi:hypothetical protein